MADKPNMIKVRLTNRGEDTETPWAEDLGPAPGPDGARKVKLANVPFLHAKPTWGDVLVVAPGNDGMPSWDRDNVPWKKIGSRILEDGGRWAMIVDYHATGDATTAFEALTKACEAHDIVCEGAWAPKPTEPGRVYLAVKARVTDASVMQVLRAAKLPLELIQVHPEPKQKVNGNGAQRAVRTTVPATPAAKRAEPDAPAEPATKRAPTAPITAKAPVRRAPSEPPPSKRTLQGPPVVDKPPAKPAPKAKPTVPAKQPAPAPARPAASAPAKPAPKAPAPAKTPAKTAKKSSRKSRN